MRFIPLSAFAGEITSSDTTIPLPDLAIYQQYSVFVTVTEGSANDITATLNILDPITGAVLASGSPIFGLPAGPNALVFQLNPSTPRAEVVLSASTSTTVQVSFIGLIEVIENTNTQAAVELHTGSVPSEGLTITMPDVPFNEFWFNYVPDDGNSGDYTCTIFALDPFTGTEAVQANELGGDTTQPLNEPLIMQYTTGDDVSLVIVPAEGATMSGTITATLGF